MQIVVNGERQDVPDDIRLAELLAKMNLEPRRVAVERNKQLVPRAMHAETALAEKDQLEIVTLVGGG